MHVGKKKKNRDAANVRKTSMEKNIVVICRLDVLLRGVAGGERTIKCNRSYGVEIILKLLKSRNLALPFLALVCHC